MIGGREVGSRLFFPAVLGVVIGWPIAALSQEQSKAPSAAGPDQRAGASDRVQADDRPARLSFRKEPDRTREFLPMVTMDFPNVPGCTCEAWCYESDLEFLDHRTLESGYMELRHRVKAQPGVLILTTVVPEPGAVEFVARAAVDAEGRPGDALPGNLPFLNICLQVRRAEGFCSKPDPYPEFVRRCFIFTDKGRTFLLDTHRRKILHRFPADDPMNNPPWVQMYVGVWQRVPDVQGQGWAEYSTDRYTIPVIGAASRDAKHLVAMANGSADTLCNAWHDCLHNNPKWTPADGPPAGRRWRVKVYAMANDPAALLARVAKDFPEASGLQQRRVPAK